MKSVSIIGFLLLTYLSLAHAQGVSSGTTPLNRYFSETWGTTDGLPHNSIHALAQTNNGYIWVGTWEGVARYNGSDFEVFGRGDVTGLPDSGIRSLHYNTINDELLIAGSRGGITTLVDGTWNAQANLPSMVNHAFKDSQARNWFALEDAGVILRTPDGSEKQYLADASAYRIAEDKRGIVWFATSRGLFHFSKDEFQPVSSSVNALHNPLFAIEVDPKGRVLVGSEQGVWRETKEGFESLHAGLNDESISSLLVDHQNSIWVGTINHGIYRLSSLGLEKLDATAGLPNNRIFSLIEDTEKSIWIGTNGGLFRLRQALFTTFTQSQGLSGNFIRTVLQAKNGSIFIGGSSGVDVFSQDQFSFISSPFPRPISALSLAQLNDDIVLVGTYTDGVLKHENGKLSLFLDRESGLPSNEVRALLVASDNSIWFGTAQGLARQKTNGELVYFSESDGLPANFIMGLAEDANGRIWVATGIGLAYYENGKIYTATFPPASDVGHAFSFFVTSKGTWMATDRGVAYFDNNTKQIRVIGKSQGLPVDKVFAVGIDEANRMWVSSNQGVMLTTLQQVTAYLKGDIDTVVFDHFKAEDGLASIQINGGSQPSLDIDTHGNVWFATAKGLATVNPNNLERISDFSVPVIIEQVLLDGKSSLIESVSDSIEVASDVTRVSFKYAGLGFAMPSRVEYQVMLEGYDNNWVDRQKLRLAEYTNLMPGTYTFRVQARYVGGQWKEYDKPVTINIQPKFYQTIGFTVAAIILLCVTILLFYKMRFRHLKKSEARLKQRVDEQTKSLELQTKRFEFQATHDQLTGLPNRRAFDSWLTEYFSRAKQESKPLCLAIIDIDFFKQVNDEYSHLVGDKVLECVAQQLKDLAPVGAKYARWGGEEFTLLLPEHSLKQAVNAVKIIQQSIELHDFSEFAPLLSITVSVGVASVENASDYNRLLNHADQALYRAKQTGRNKVESELS